MKKNKIVSVVIIAMMSTLLSTVANAQVMKVSLQASGLTCSMCSNSINKALKTLSFVDNVDPNIQTSTFEITFKPGSDVDFDAIKKKVDDAGFSVANFIVTIHFKDVPVKPNEIVEADGQKFVFVNTKEQSLTGLKRLKLVDKGFVSSKEYRKNAAAMALTQKGIHNVIVS